MSLDSIFDPNLKIAVLIPCYNEEVSIAQVISDFRVELPNSLIYVYDNNSSDRTIQVAREAGAIVRTERMQGKGHVIRRMFADIDADYYVLVDGDATYEAASVSAMLDAALTEGLDMVNGARVTDREAAYRPGHVLGNKVLTGLVTAVFGRRLSDMLSGYRVFSRRFVKSFPALSSGFETETEFTVHALELGMPIGEISTSYIERLPGSTSKLSTYSDGVIILKTIINLIKQERPLVFFSIFAFIFAAIGVILGIPIIINYIDTGFVPRLPTALLAASCMIISALSMVCGLILDSVTLGRREQKRMHYLALPAPKQITEK
ncbi:glycosyltransferase family 2 protein [Gluconobacter albidus]|uniref:glycosyltransferase family 2 protein n=1 Tax=Gluconobacter albidus TaxID=318683 RepID=UPI001FCA0086|nr:glycosyltransferase family 2 protein [Gluconobacter albidus]